MRKVVVVILLAGMLVLVLAVPAMAGKPAGEDPSWYGRLHQTLNWSFDVPPPDENPPAVPPGHRTNEIPESPFEGNPGQVISQVIHGIIQGDPGIPGIKNWGKWTNVQKAAGPAF